MKKITTALFLASALSAGVRAATYVWDGGSAVDSNWSSDANWNPDGAPLSASDTLLQFNGGARLTPTQNIAVPFLLNRLEFLGGATYTTAFTIGGNALQFVTNGVTQPRLYLNRNASCVITNAIDIPAGATLYAEIGTYGLELRGPVTGGGAIDKQAQAGGLTLSSGANTFSGGLTVRANNDDWFKVNINASGAMGTGPVSLYGGTLATNRVNPGGLSFYNTATHTNDISLFATSPVFAAMPNGNNANVALNGAVDLNTYTLHLRGGGLGTVGGVISEGGANALVKSDAGTWTLGGANTFAGRVSLVNGTLKLGPGGSLLPQVALAFSCATGWSSLATATFDLNGRDQAVSRLDGWTTHPWLTNVLTSATAATLVVDQGDATLFNGRLTGALSLVKAGAGTLTLSNYPSVTSGGITVSNGTLAVAAGASLDAGGVTAAGGRLELYAASAIADAASLSVWDGAKVLLAGGGAETVDKLFINGVQQPRGTYGSTASGALFTDDAHFEGAGMISVRSNPPVAAVDATWDAEGGDTLLSTDANWAGDSRPAFDGTTRAIFGTGGLTATVDVAASTYGLVFNRDGAFTLAAGSGLVSNGAGGIVAAAPTTSSRTYTLVEDLVLADHQTWQAATNWPGATTLTVSGSVDDGVLPCDITKTGFGPLRLTASNAFDGVVAVNEGDLNISHAQALGSTNGHTVINGSSGGRLVLSGGLTVAEPLILNGEKNNNGTLVVGSGSNVVSAPVTCYNQVRLQGYNGPLVFTGGVTADNNGLFVVNSGSVVTFKDRPLNLGSRTFWSDSGGVSVLAVAGNTWADTLCAGGGIRCEVPNALPPTAALRLGVGYSPSGTLNLAGNDQTIGRLYLDTPVPAARVITSATPACLTVNQSSDTLIDARFTGAVSLLKLGAGTLTLTNAFTSTSGSFAVSNGTLWVGRDGTLGLNCTNVTVGGTGRLTLTNSVTIADTATVSLPAAGTATAKLDLAAGVNEKVGWLFLGSRMMRAGVYGSTSSSAPPSNQDNEHFSGPGVLTVLSDKSGTIVLLQ